MKCAELHITGLEDLITSSEVIEAVTRAGGCSGRKVRKGEIRRSSSGLGSAWVKCPTSAAKRVADAGRLKIGWTGARVEVFSSRPLQCYRQGHARQRCTADKDRSGVCYRYGQEGHTTSKYSARSHCPLCADAGRPAEHRLDGRACHPTAAKKKGSGAQDKVRA